MYDLPTIFPKTANQLSLFNIIQHCLEDDKDDDLILNQKRQRSYDISCMFRLLIDDAVTSNWYLNLYNQIGRDKTINDKNIPIWIDNLSFFKSEKHFKTK